METARLSHEITASILQALVNCFYSQYSKVMDGFIRYTDPALNEVSAPILLRTHPFMAMQSIAGHRPVTFRCHCFFFLGGRFDRPAAPIAVHLSLNVSSIGGRIDPKILEKSAQFRNCADFSKIFRGLSIGFGGKVVAIR